MKKTRWPQIWVFVTLLVTYAFFWQSRDWNSASRLMMTYALVDRGTIAINGMEDQTGDRASFRGRAFTDKLPGFSFLAVIPYAAAKAAFRLPDHPLNVPGMTHWPADYWVTLATSGLLTALTGAWLAGLALDLGCGPRRAALVGLTYGLATPAYAYATMSYGHQATAFALTVSFTLLWRTGSPRPTLQALLAGFLAAAASVIELQVGPISALLGLYLLALVILKCRKVSDLGAFAVGALPPTLLLLGYNQAAFGSPFDMGYFHHATKIFADVHNEENPLGLRSPGLSTAFALIWGRHRGLLFYAPVVALVPFGLWTLARVRFWGVLAVSSLVMAAVFAVNVSYPEWTGGWSTGPRLLVPLLPFAMLPIAAWLGAGGRMTAVLVGTAALAGSLLMLLFVGVGGRLPQFLNDPLVQAVWPLWKGAVIPGWPGDRFTRTAFEWSSTSAQQAGRLSDAFIKFAPLVAFQALSVAFLAIRGRSRRAQEPGAAVT